MFKVWTDCSGLHRLNPVSPPGIGNAIPNPCPFVPAFEMSSDVSQICVRPLPYFHAFPRELHVATDVYFDIFFEVGGQDLATPEQAVCRSACSTDVCDAAFVDVERPSPSNRPFPDQFEVLSPVFDCCRVTALAHGLMPAGNFEILVFYVNEEYERKKD